MIFWLKVSKSFKIIGKIDKIPLIPFYYDPAFYENLEKYPLFILPKIRHERVWHFLKIHC